MIPRTLAQRQPTEPASRSGIISQPAPASSMGDRPLTFRIASSQADRYGAFRLVYSQYVEKQLIPPNRYRMRLTPYHLLPTTVVFIAEAAGAIVGTVTLIADGGDGLPMDGVHPEITYGSRRRGVSQGEVSSLAICGSRGRTGLSIFLGLTRLGAQYARSQGIDQLLINCTPQHARFYCRHLGFRQIGRARSYPSLCNTQGVACCLNLARLDREHPDMHQSYFGSPLPASMLCAAPMTAFERAAFGQVLDDSSPALRNVV